MTTEEKAKAYDEAMNKIKPLYEQAKRDGNPIWSTYKYLIPELRKEEKPLTPFQQCLYWILRAVYYAEVPYKEVNEFILKVVRTRTDELVELAKRHKYTDCQRHESDDEKFRKYILQVCKECVEANDRGLELSMGTTKKLLAYLEKQKEEEGYEAIPVESTLEYKLGFKAGRDSEKQKEQPKEELVYRLNGLMQDYIKEGKDDEEKEHRLKCYQLFWDALEDTSYFEQKEQRFLNISAASKWLRDNVCNYVNSEYNEFHKCVEYDGSIDKERLINDFEKAMQKEQKPADLSKMMVHKEPYVAPVPTPMVPDEPKPAEWGEDIIRKAIKEVGLTQHQIDWFKTNVFPPKQEWSEEDEKMLDDICSLLYATHEERDKMQKWLKSLRPHWKPSEEHLSALLAVFNDPNNIGSQTCQLALTDLYEQLKKLGVKEEPEYYQHFDPDC